MAKVTLTHYWHAKHLDVPAFSIAVSQPEGFDLPELECFKPIDAKGKWLSKRDDSFRKSYEETLNRNQAEVAEWVDSIDSDVALCCWCKSKDYELDRCHRILIGILLKRLRPDLDIEINSKNPAWRR